MVLYFRNVHLHLPKIFALFWTPVLSRRGEENVTKESSCASVNKQVSFGQIMFSPPPTKFSPYAGVSHDLCLTNGKILCPKKALNNKKGINLLSYNSYFAVLNPCWFVAWRAPSNTVNFSLQKLEVLVLMSLGFYRHLQYCLVRTVFLILLRFVKRPIQILYKSLF